MTMELMTVRARLLADLAAVDRSLELCATVVAAHPEMVAEPQKIHQYTRLLVGSKVDQAPVKVEQTKAPAKLTPNLVGKSGRVVHSTVRSMGGEGPVELIRTVVAEITEPFTWRSIQAALTNRFGEKGRAVAQKDISSTLGYWAKTSKIETTDPAVKTNRPYRRTAQFAGMMGDNRSEKEKAYAEFRAGIKTPANPED